MNNSSLWIVLHRMRTPILVLITTYTVAIAGFLFIDGVDANGNPYQMSIFDAFYVVTYTATTIGFGEIPHEFTYAQRIWMSMVVYAVVLGWFYSIGALITLLQDKLLLSQIAEARFIRQVKKITEPFIIVLGYNHITSKIIKKANQEKIRTVVIEKNEDKANELFLENYTPYVPCLIADIYDPNALEKAGINLPNCKAVVSLFKNDNLNLRAAMSAKFLNKNVTLAVKATTGVYTQDLKDLGIEIIENPFEIITNQIEMLINNPYLLVIQRWLYDISPLTTNIKCLPKEKYLVCGFGRMGQILYEMGEKNNIDMTFIETNKRQIRGLSKKIREHIILGNADEKDVLIEAGIKESSVIIVATDDDTLNLAILTAARKLNSNIITIVRENEMIDLSIFQNAKFDYVFIPSLVLVRKTINALIAPYSNAFLEELRQGYDINFAKNLIKQIKHKIGINPITFGIKINEHKAYAIFQEIKKGKIVRLEVFSRSRQNRELKNKILPLILIRDEKRYIMPFWDMQLKENDKILFAANEDSKDDALWIAKNLYEFHYIYYGKEKNFFDTLFRKRV
jgi:Trk K+ transport system NAD-binding subunit